jgi:tetratricopeptide (TPR) repeat protein
MKSRPRQCFICLVAISLCLLLASQISARTEDEKWTSVQSKNFTLIGNASEREIRKFAARLEQFREAFMRLLSVEHFDTSVPMTVMVFRDDESYRPFEPLYHGQPAEVAGFFQPNQDVDYLTFSIDRQHVREPDALAFHEYVHLLVRNSFRNVPLWFNEGLAEYYSTFEISDGNRHVTLGKPINGRIQTLKTHELVPLETLFKADGDSEFYNEPNQRSLFYAEAWALVHYLLSGERRAQLATYLDLLAKGTQVKDAFKQAFQTDFAGMENELRQYIHLNKYQQQEITFDKRLEFDPLMRSSALTEAEAQFYLGDLLLHTNRLDAAESYLQKAIALDPNLAEAQAALGVLRVKQSRFDEAKRYLESASAKSESFLIHYYYAYVLSREPLGSDNSTDVYYTPENARLMRDELKKAIALSPHFAEAYRLLAFVNLVRDEYLDESTALLKKAIELSPRRQDFSLLLAQVYLHLNAFETARTVLRDVMQKCTDPQLYARAQDLLTGVAAQEELVAHVKALEAEVHKEETPPGIIQPCDAPQPGPQIKKLRFEGVQVCGQLVKIECADQGVTLFVEAGNSTLKLHSDKLNNIRFVTYTADVRGQVTCGLREPANPVLVTYRPPKDAKEQIDGEVIAVEFVPQDWSANH